MGEWKRTPTHFLPRDLMLVSRPCRFTQQKEPTGFNAEATGWATELIRSSGLAGEQNLVPLKRIESQSLAIPICGSDFNTQPYHLSTVFSL